MANLVERNADQPGKEREHAGEEASVGRVSPAVVQLSLRKDSRGRDRRRGRAGAGNKVSAATAKARKGDRGRRGINRSGRERHRAASSRVRDHRAKAVRVSVSNRAGHRARAGHSLEDAAAAGEVFQGRLPEHLLSRPSATLSSIRNGREGEVHHLITPNGRSLISCLHHQVFSSFSFLQNYG
jgi:hypothetical protein